MAHKTAALMRFSSASQAASAGAIAVASEEVENGGLRRLRRERERQQRQLEQRKQLARRPFCSQATIHIHIRNRTSE